VKQSPRRSYRHEYIVYITRPTAAAAAATDDDDVDDDDDGADAWWSSQQRLLNYTGTEMTGIHRV